MIITSLWCPAYSLIIPGLNIMISFIASSDIVNRKQSEQYMEIYSEIDTLMMSKWDRIR